MADDDIQDGARSALARRLSADVHDGVEPRESRALARPFGRLGEQRNEAGGDPIRRAFILQEFRYGILAQHQIGEDHGFERRVQPHDDLGEERDLVGGDRRHPGKREFERDRARCSKRRARGAERGPLFRRLDDDARNDRPAGNPLPRAGSQELA